MLEIPVYLITGFLESGKTSFLEDVLFDGEFADGDPALLIRCEDGEKEYDEKQLAENNVTLLPVEEEEDFTVEFLRESVRTYRPQKIFIEMNGMWDIKWIFENGLPGRLELAQTITIVDGSTFPVYLNNMRSILSNLFQYTEMVIFNRCTHEMDLHAYRRTVRGLNAGAMVYFEDSEGEPIDPGMEMPPYDLTADVIDISDMDFGLWFLDATDNPERYKGKKVRFLAKVMKPRRLPENMFIPGRNAMTCCADDIRFIGYLCESDFTPLLKSKQWITLTAEIHYEYRKEYGAEGPVLHGISYETTEKPADELVYFN